PDHGIGASRLLLAGSDAVAWIVGIVAADAVRVDLVPRLPHPGRLAEAVAMAVVFQLVLGLASGLYRGRWRFASFEHVAAVGQIGFLTTVVLVVANLLDGRLVPESVPLFGGVAALVLMMAGRYLARTESERRRRPGGDGCTRLVVFGAGGAAAEAIATMLRDPDSPYLPVALLDDQRARRHLSIMGVPVLGTRQDLARVATATRAEMVLIALRSAPAVLIREISDLAAEAGLALTVLPTLRELIEGSARPGDIRTPTMADLLGRREVQTDLLAAAGYLAGRRVMVTGAGGSIGSELCRQIHGLGPAELIMVDRDESALHALKLSMEGRAMLDSPDLVLLDIRDRPGVERMLAARRPEVVFHAAALKHLPMLECHPAEAVKTNVWGTLNVLEASAAHGVERFVNISTDKAVNPTSVLGYSKRICERLTAAVATGVDGTYLSVRFGNVLGSRGSVLGTFQAQVAGGGPVTVTDPEVTRYFMTVEEAVQLVIQAGAVGGPGEALVLDMGEPVRIVDVARRMIAEAGREIDIVYTGLRRGEKPREELLGDGEPDRRPRHPLISHVPVPPLPPDRVYGID
ncbi:MAG: polysaccharide biosynthesis protein, partial [Acidimicrobiales bacterium]